MIIIMDYRYRIQRHIYAEMVLILFLRNWLSIKSKNLATIP